MESRQRAVDRRRLGKIAVLFGVGAALAVIGLVLGPVLPDHTEAYYDAVGHRKEDPEFLIVVIGAILMISALGDLVIRLVKGPQMPSKRARD